MSTFNWLFWPVWSEVMKLIDVVFPQSSIFPSAFDRLHCHLQRANDRFYLLEGGFQLLSR